MTQAEIEAMCDRLHERVMKEIEAERISSAQGSASVALMGTENKPVTTDDPVEAALAHLQGDS